MDIHLFKLFAVDANMGRDSVGFEEKKMMNVKKLRWGLLSHIASYIQSWSYYQERKSGNHTPLIGPDLMLGNVVSSRLILQDNVDYRNLESAVVATIFTYNFPCLNVLVILGF